MSFRGKGQVGSTLVFFWNLRVHHISSFFFSLCILFFCTRRDHKHKHALVVAFFITFGRKLSHLDLHSLYLWRVIFFCIVLILEEVAHYQNVFCLFHRCINKNLSFCSFHPWKLPRHRKREKLQIFYHSIH